MGFISTKKPGIYFILIPIFSVLSSCHTNPAPVIKPHPSFKPVLGIPFTEVKRTFKSGLSFSDQGFQLEPDWKLTFVSEDSVFIYSPEKKRFFNCPVIFDHDSIFNVAWAWLRLKKLTKDSVKFQVLEVQNKQILDDRSVVYMTLYSDHYIKDVLHSDSATLVRPGKQDTVYIKHKIKLANADFGNAFSARTPVTLKSNNPLVIVQKTSAVKSELDNITVADDYLTPEFNIGISKAYDNFTYHYVILVDAAGQMHFIKSSVMQMPEFAEAENRMMTGVTNGYLKHYLTVTAGTTLGIPHASKILVHVRGRKG